jgi:tricarballylate dehydrogenase
VPSPDRVDVVVVGAGNAAFCAALAAREAGANVLVLESASEAERGGNTRYAAGQMRVGFGEPDNLPRLVEGLDASGLDGVHIDAYHPSDFFDDVARLTQYRTDLELMDMVASRSFDTLVWMRRQGVRRRDRRSRRKTTPPGRRRSARVRRI